MPSTFKIEAQGADGKTYWLSNQEPAERAKGSCGGCAFNGLTQPCRTLIASHACIQQTSCWFIWREKAPVAFGCDNAARGYGVCEKHCGSDACVNSQG